MIIKCLFVLFFCCYNLVCTNLGAKLQKKSDIRKFFLQKMHIAPNSSPVILSERQASEVVRQASEVVRQADAVA